MRPVVFNDLFASGEGKYSSTRQAANVWSFIAADGHMWLEQNPQKRSKWASLAREGRERLCQIALFRLSLNAFFQNRGIG